MLTFLRFVSTLADRFVSRVWNFFAGLRRKRLKVGLWLGFEIQDGHTTRKKVFLANNRRAEHLSITGKTGTGKSYFLRSLIAQDLEQRNGIVLFDVHGDLTPYVLQAVSNLERKTGQDLSKKLIIIDPSDPESSCGFNVLEGRGEQNIYRLISEFTHILQNRWGQEFGPRTLELLSNSLHVLSENNLTLLELPALLTNASFRAQCLKRVTNNEVKAYFESRFNPASEAMQQAMSGPVLNKLAGFTIDPKFRHLLGQAESTLSLQQVLEKNLWLVIKLSKGELGEQAMTFGSLLFAKLKAAIFARRSRSLLSVYADEVQNLLSSDLALEVLLSECRKFNVSIVTANQYFAQLPAQVQAAMAAIGTRRYATFNNQNDLSAHWGIQFFDGANNPIVNYPKYHISHGEDKNSATRTNGRYKQIIRLFKNFRNYLVDNNLLTDGAAPSYFIECALHNVPDRLFAGALNDVVPSIIDHLNQASYATLLCQNGVEPLIGNGSTQWAVVNFVEFVSAAKSGWDNW